MNAKMVIETVRQSGGALRLIDGGLQAKNLDEITRPLIKQHKAEIIQLLSVPSVEPNLKTCPLCKGYNFTHSHNGGYFCTTCQPMSGVPVRAGSIRLPTILKDIKLHNDFSKERINKIASEWLHEHKIELLAGGWTPAELYKPRGIVWLLLWKKSDLKVTVNHDFSIHFSFNSPTGQRITQTAYPKRGRQL